jgi:hypothetical protein
MAPSTKHQIEIAATLETSRLSNVIQAQSDRRGAIARLPVYLLLLQLQGSDSDCARGSSGCLTSLDVIRRAFENAGVDFIDENGGGPGLRLRKSSQEKLRK